MQQWTVNQLAQALADNPNLAILDVREPWEYEMVHLTPSTLIPLGYLTQRLDELDVNQSWVIVCHHGVRSMQAAYILEHYGFDVINLQGGIDQWAKTIDTTLPLY